MSPIGRIFIVLNLILSAAFLGWAANALAQTDDYKGQLEAAQADAAATIAELESDRDDLEIKVRQANENEDTRREERDAAIAEKERLESELETANREKTSLLGDVTSIKATLDDYRVTFQELTAAKDRAVQERHDMEQERDDAVAAQTDAEQAQRNAEDAQAAAERRIADLEVERTDLQGEVDKLDTRLAVLVEATGTSYEDILVQKDIKGAVLGVDMSISPGLVMLNVGSDDGVKKGYTFNIHSNTEFKGEVKVLDVQAAMCSAIIEGLSKGATIRQGDSASTRL